MTVTRVLIFSILFITATARPSDEKANTKRREIPSNPNSMIGVASIAGIASRNGRVSSVTGVKLIPDMESVHMNKGVPSYFYPLTVTKEGDGKYASGTIQIYPGSVMVSSSARTGFGPEIKPWSPKLDMHLADDMFLPPIDLFNAPRSIKPLFPADIFRPLPPPQINDFGTWLYPNFNPFLNFWR